MFAEIRKFVQETTALFQIPRNSMLTTVSGQPSTFEVGHLTPGLNYADANITCADGYDKFACPYLYS
jgi:hypothetical protein